MRRFLYYLFLFTVLLSCEDNKLTSRFNLKPLDATIELPSSYINIDTSNFQNFVFNERDSLYRRELYNDLKNNAYDFYLIDSLNYKRFILIAEIEPYERIDSSLFWFIIDRERKISSSKPTIDSTYFIGSKMGGVGDFPYIESKYCRLGTLNRKRYGYVFTISSEKKSLGICFFSPEDQDVKPFINSIRKN